MARTKLMCNWKEKPDFSGWRFTSNVSLLLTAPLLLYGCHTSGRQERHRRRLDNDGCDFRVLLITRFTLTVTWWTFFFPLISAKLKTQFSSRFKANSSQRSRAASQLPQVTGRVTVCSEAQTQNWTPTHHFQRGISQGMLAAWDSPRGHGDSSWRFQGRRSGKLGPRSCWEDFSWGRLGMDAFGAEHDSLCGVTKEKARGWLDFEEMHFWDNRSPAL